MLEKSPSEIRKLILNQIKIGQAIRSQRIDYVDDLEEARAEKQEWVSRTCDLLKQLFADKSIVEQCNDWVGPILPEYAEWNLFVEQFNNEMKHRLGRLTDLLHEFDETPELQAQAERSAMTTTTPTPTKPAARTTNSLILLLPRAMDEQSIEPIRQFLESLDLPTQKIDISIDGAGGWQLSLARQLKSAGVAVDLNRLI